MTIQDRNAILQQLKEDPLLFYKTMVENVAQLDKLRQRFQYMLSAYESHMDPAVLQTYHEQRRAEQEAQLRGPGVTQNNGTYTTGEEPRKPVFPPQAANPQTEGNGLNQMPRFTTPRVNQPDAPPVKPIEAPRLELLDKLIDVIHESAKRESGFENLTRETVAAYVMSSRDRNILSLVEGLKSSTNLDAQQVHHEPGQGMPTQEEANEFPMNDAGATARTLYSQGGLLSKILSKKFHRYGEGPVSTIDSVIPSMSRVVGNDLFWANNIRIPFDLNQGIYTTQVDFINNMGAKVVSEQSIGILLHGGMFKYWLPLYLNQSPSAPFVYVHRPIITKDDKVEAYEEYQRLDFFDTMVISRMMNELTRTLSLWYGTLQQHGLFTPRGRPAL